MKLDPVFVLSPAEPAPDPVAARGLSRRGLLGAVLGLSALAGSAALGAALAGRRAEAHRATLSPADLSGDDARRWARELGTGALDDLVRHAPGFVAQLSIAPDDAGLRHGAVRLAQALADAPVTSERRRSARALQQILERVPRTEVEDLALRQLAEVAR